MKTESETGGEKFGPKLTTQYVKNSFMLIPCDHFLTSGLTILLQDYLPTLRCEIFCR